MYRDTGSPATSPLIVHVDSAQAGLPVYPNGGDVVCVVDTVNGLFTL